MYCLVLHCTKIYCTVLYFTVPFCTTLHCTLFYSSVTYCSVLYCTVMYCILLYCTELHCTILYYTVLYCTVCTTLYSTVLYFSYFTRINFHKCSMPAKFLSSCLRISERHKFALFSLPLLHSFSEFRIYIILSHKLWMVVHSKCFPSISNIFRWYLL